MRIVFASLVPEASSAASSSGDLILEPVPGTSTSEDEERRMATTALSGLPRVLVGRFGISEQLRRVVVSSPNCMGLAQNNCFWRPMYTLKHPGPQVPGWSGRQSSSFRFRTEPSG